MSIIAELKDVHKYYKIGSNIIKAINGISLKINKGDFISIVGPSGSGKTTLLNILGLLDRPDKGIVVIEGKDASKLNDSQLSKFRSEKIGFIFQTFNLIPSLTAKENVELAASFSNKVRNPEEKAVELLKLVGLGNRIDHKPSELSGGEQQRVAIARALMNDPILILADEPTGNLDSKTSEEIFSIFKELNSKGITIVVATHNLKLAEESKRIIRLKDGIIEYEVQKSS